MCRVLILDDDIHFARSLQPVVNRFEGNGGTTSDLATTLDEALEFAKKAVQMGTPYTVFLVDQRLGSGKDGIAAMGELKDVSPTSDAIIFTGIEDPEGGIRAYRAGAFRYLTKPIEVEELTFVLDALMRWRREIVENKWRKTFSEMMETALHRSSFSDVARVVVEHSIQLGFKRAHLLWAPWQSDTNQRNIFVGVECAGDGCIREFSKLRFHLHAKAKFASALQPRDAVCVQDGQSDDSVMIHRELESIGLSVSESGCWILPLWGGQELLGALLLDFGKTIGYLSAHEQTLLNFFARQASVTLEHASIYSRDKRTSEEMILLQRASVEMLRIANRSEEHFWLTVLTIATARFGLGFNRALLFLRKENEPSLLGRAAVGENDTQAAMRDWELDEARDYDFDAFLADVTEDRLEPTSLHTFLHNMEIPIAEFGYRICEVLMNGRITELSEQEALEEFPASIQQEYSPARCALLPLQVGNQTLGLVVVDNKHNNKPLNWKSLEHLKSLLVNVGLVWETLRQRSRNEDLLEANHEILGGAGHQTLQETLSIICKTARKFSQANWALIFPVRKTDKPPLYEFELEQFGYDGRLKSVEELSRQQPEMGGVSMRVLQQGRLIVNDLDSDRSDIAELKLYESHFIKREEVKALMGIAIRDPYAHDPLGILYLDYLQPHNFTLTEIRHASSFARLAAVAISNHRRLDEWHRRRQMRTALEISETVGIELNIEEIMVNVLEKLQDLFRNTALCVLLYDEDKKALEFAPRTLKYYKIINPQFQSLRTFPVDGPESRSLACRVARMALQTRKQEHYHAKDVNAELDYLPLNPRTVSEYCVSLMDSGGSLLGVLALEREESAFEEDDMELVDVVAHQLALAIERSKSSERLAFKETMATMYSWASEIAHDVNNEVAKIRGHAYLIKQLSKDPVLLRSAEEIDSSARNLTSVGPWSTQSRVQIPLNASLRRSLVPIANRRGVDLDLDLCDPDVLIRANPMELERVLRHLVRNSARAMEGKETGMGKKISILTRCLPDGKAEILFRDYGPGIDDEVRAAIFQRKATTKPPTPGGIQGGYGLLISRQLVDDMNGKITLLPAVPGQGATFSIKLPIVEPDSGIENYQQAEI